MRFGSLPIIFCTLLLAISTASTYAGRVLVYADTHAPGLPVSMNVEDSEITSVLSALFNATDNSRQVRIGFGVSGNIDSLDLENVPFDTALTKVLEAVNTEYSFAKSNATTYHIKAPSEAIVAPIMTFTQAELVDDTVKMIKVMLPVMPKTTTDTATVPTVDPITGEAPVVEEEPTAEEAILAVIKIRNINVVYLAEALGYEYLEAFGYSDRNDSGSRTGRSSRNRNDPYYDDPYYNDPYYNDPYYDDPYNRDTRDTRYNNTTRWTDPASPDYSRRYTDTSSPYYDRRADPRSRYYEPGYTP